METCPLGTHHVRQHQRKIKGGYIVVQAHCRISPKGKEKTLYASNLRHMYYSKNHQYSNLPSIKGFGGFHKYDPMIQFWTSHWKEMGLLPESFDPLLIKSIIATESSFREDVITAEPNSTAAGLMQIVRSTLKPLKGEPDENNYVEIRAHQIDIEYSELLDPVVNIGAGVRWLAHKISQSPKRKSKDPVERIFSGVKYYHSWTEEEEAYAQKVFRAYEASKSKEKE